MEVKLDRSSLRRYHRGAIVFLAAIALVFASGLFGPVLSAVPGREAGGRAVHALMLIGFVTALLLPPWGTWDVVHYRCPQCRRRLSRVYPEGDPEANRHDYCADCRVIWDRGWTWRGGGEGGG